MAESLSMTRMTTADASEWAMASANLVATLEAPEAPPSSPALEGKTMLETFLSRQRRWLAVDVAATTHLDPAFLIS
jgi:hypothetical protein